MSVRQNQARRYGYQGPVGRWAACLLLPLLSVQAQADDWCPDAERGREALTQRSYLAPSWKWDAYAQAGSLWEEPAPDPVREPEAYAAAFNERYGLHPAPYPNDGLPMGLRRTPWPDGSPGLAIDCMVCHGGSIGGQSLVGLGNTTLDLKGLLTDLTLANGEKPPVSVFQLNTARGTNNAGQIAAVLLSLRNPDLTLRRFPLLSGAWLPELDTPPWWNLGVKTTKYYDGRTDVRAARSNMQFLLGDEKVGQAELTAVEPAFRDIDAYLKSIKPPAYPFAIDQRQAARGEAVFRDRCVRCHGTQGEGASYPNKVVPIDVIGTDPARLKGLTERFIDHYNATWMGQDYPVVEPAIGYQAPPLAGIWASAPYLHNGSVPTLHHLLSSTERPARFRRAVSTSLDHYDREKVGWLFEQVTEPAPANLPARQQRMIYDTARFGLGNQGHTFGDALDERERRDLIEYLKTL